MLMYSGTNRCPTAYELKLQVLGRPPEVRPANDCSPLRLRALLPYESWLDILLENINIGFVSHLSISRQTPLRLIEWESAERLPSGGTYFNDDEHTFREDS